MAENNTTILSEHRRVFTVRHIFAFINFIAVFFSTAITITLLNKRGCADMMKLIMYVMLGINALQIALCLADYILKGLFGIYVRALPIISLCVAVLWVGSWAGEMLVATAELGEMRVDLIIVLAIQAVVAISAYLIWPMLDRKAIDAMTRPSVRHNEDLRRKRSKKYVVTYIFLCLFVVAAQAGVLFTYKMPPRFYDLFEASRAIKYELSEDGTSYIVAGVYRGTSNYLNIPAEYNNKPVVGIAKGAIVDDDVFDSHKITEIVFGTKQTDENGVETLVSNLKYVASGAIVNNSITQLTLPGTVGSIGEGAVVSSSLETLNYQSATDFDIAFFQATNLKTVLMTGANVGKIASIEGIGENVKIEVAKDIYNEYRQANYAYVNAFRPIMSEEEYCVDFFTNCDYYIESIFCKIGETLELSVDSFVNEKINGTSLRVDTQAYIENNHELGTNGAKANSAFRGWYFNSTFTDECKFSENGTIKINKNTEIHAKWLEEYTATLNWGTHKPNNQADKQLWTDEDLAVFPVIEDRSGYQNGIQWKVAGTNKVVEDSSTLSGNVTLNGTWILDTPTIDVIPEFFTSLENHDYSISTDKNIARFTYDESSEIALKADYEHPLDGVRYEGNQIQYSYKWSKQNDASFHVTTDSFRSENVADSGVYTLEITARSPWGESAKATSQVEVEIKKKAIDLGSATLANSAVTYNTYAQKLEYTGQIASNNIAVEYQYYKDNALVQTGNGVTAAGTYHVKAIFKKNNNAEAANYQEKTIDAVFTIQKATLTYVSWSSDSLEYNASEQTVTMEVAGALEDVQLLYKNNSNKARNAGTYKAEVIGVNNDNYTIENLTNKVHTWNITKKTIIVGNWSLNGVSNQTSVGYTDNDHSVAASMDGNFAGDDVSFVYNGENYGKNANTYTARITGLSGNDAGNYEFNKNASTASYTWTINKATLSINFQGNAYTYKAANQGTYANVSGFKGNDASEFSAESFLYVGSDIVGVKGTSDSGMRLNFYAKNAGTYNVGISGLNSETITNNYQISAIAHTFTIQPKSLSMSLVSNAKTYNASTQNWVAKISGIMIADLSAMQVDNFAVKLNSNTITPAKGEVKSEVYQLTIEDVSIKNAGAYTISIEQMLNNSNYTISASQVGTINPSALSIVWKTQNNSTGEVKSALSSVTYNGSLGYTMLAVAQGVKGEDEVNLSVENATKNAASATQYQSVARLPQEYTNYVFAGDAKTSYTWSITPKTLAITWLLNDEINNTLVYNGQNHQVEVVYSGNLEDDEITFEMSSTGFVGKNVGTYTAKIIKCENSNYTVDSNKFDWEIEVKEVSLTWKTTDFTSTYNAQYQGPEFTLSEVCDTGLRLRVNFARANYSSNYYFDVVNDSNYSFATHNVAKAAASYGISGFVLMKDGVADGNYKLLNTTSKTFTIEKKTIKLYDTWSLDGALHQESVVYDKTTHNVATEEMPGFIEAGDSIVISYSLNNKTNVDKYTTKVTGIGNSNYELDKEYSFTWEIMPKAISLTWNEQSNPFTNNTQKHEAQFTGVISGDRVTLVYQTNTGKEVGEYTSIVTGVSNSNYTLATGTPTTHKWTITKRVIDGVSWDKEHFTYNGANQYPVATYTYNGLTVGFDYVKNTNSKNVGEYTINIKSVNNANFELNENVNFTKAYEISPKSVTVAWSSDSLTYNGNAQSLTASISGAVSGETVAFSYVDGNSLTNVGTKTVTVQVNDPNYTITGNAYKTLTINKRTVTVSWSGATSVTYDGQPHSITATVTGVKGENIPVAYNGNQTETNKGSYSVSVSISDPNYTLSGTTSKSWKINAQPVKITWTGAGEYVYDGNAHELSVSVVGANDGKNVPVNLARVSLTNVDSTKLTVTALADDNYTLSGYVGSNSATLTITQAPVSITWSGATNVTYSGQDHELIATVTGVNGESVGFNYDSKGNKFKNVGPHTATIASLTNTNYKLNVKSGSVSKSMTINQKQLTLTWGTTTFEYEYGKTYSTLATVNGVVAGDSVNVTYNGNSFANAGEYQVSANVDNSNYKLSNASVTCTVLPQAVKITWNANEYVYDGSVHALTATVVGLKDGRPVSIEYAGENSLIDVGEKQVEIEIIDGNYKLEGADGSAMQILRITPREVQIGVRESMEGNAKVYEFYVENPVGDDVVTLVTKMQLKAGANIFQEISPQGGKYYITTFGDYVVTVTGVSGSDSANYFVTEATEEFSYQG